MPGGSFCLENVHLKGLDFQVIFWPMDFAWVKR
jgi:hypothetical protein